MPAPLKLIRKNTQPPGGWRYKHPETGWWTTGGHFDDLVSKAVQYRKDNHLPVGTNFEDDVQHQLCGPLGPEWCAGALPALHPGGFTFKALIQGTKTLVDWALNGGQVSLDEADRRAVVCSTCPMNQDSQGCETCNSEQVADLVAKMAFKGEIPHGRYLRSCAICQCKLAIKVRVPLDIIQRNMPDDQQNALPDFCWCKKEELKAVA